LEVLTARDYPASQCLAWDIDAMAAQHFFKAVKR
jgi:hypothetical protein